ncbi:MAG: ABC transporter ATP-binding protein/permease [Clostridiales bacterium]|nr:ABC transporter ATP-binding protein/permease [Clostridiales bacterium]
MDAVKWTLRMARKDMKLLIAGILISLLPTALVFVNPVVYSHIIDDVFTGGRMELLLPYAASVVGIVLLRAALIYVNGLMIETATQNTIRRLRLYLYDKLGTLDSGFYSQNRTGDLMMKLSGDLDWVRHFLSWIIPNTVSNLIIFVVTLVIFFITSPLMTLAALILTPFTAYATYRLRKVMRPAHDKVRAETSALNVTVQENISGNRVVKAFVRENHEIEKFEERNQAYCRASIDSVRTWWSFGPFISGIASSMSIVLLVMGGIGVVRGNLTLGQLSLFLNLTWGLNQPMNLIGTIMNDYQRFMASVDKIMTIYYAQPDIKNGDAPVKNESPKGEIELRDCSFSYSGQKILKHINFTAHAGETIGIMGPTGSGKTTITSLIARFIDPSDGAVFVDGVDVRDYDLHSLRGMIGMAMQDVFLFSDTIDSNIAYGRPDSSEEWVHECAVDADADSFIRRTPQGYETIIGERGVGLSGGQRQRLSLARALAYDTPILILDDTTSAVDMETEHYIQERLRNRKKRATTIVIAQRITSVRDADRIYIVENGEITECGTHEELLEKRGYYYNIFRLQQGLSADAAEAVAKAAETKRAAEAAEEAKKLALEGGRV